jgi:hypothetical protein
MRSLCAQSLLLTAQCSKLQMLLLPHLLLLLLLLSLLTVGNFCERENNCCNTTAAADADAACACVFFNHLNKTVTAIHADPCAALCSKQPSF